MFSAVSFASALRDLKAFDSDDDSVSNMAEGTTSCPRAGCATCRGNSSNAQEKNSQLLANTPLCIPEQCQPCLHGGKLFERQAMLLLKSLSASWPGLNLVLLRRLPGMPFVIQNLYVPHCKGNPGTLHMCNAPTIEQPLPLHPMCHAVVHLMAHATEQQQCCPHQGCLWPGHQRWHAWLCSCCWPADIWLDVASKSLCSYPAAVC
jgi:hypothetical protein